MLLTANSSASARRPGDELHYGPSHLTNSLKWPEERLYQQSIRRAVLEGSREEEEQYRREREHYDSYESPPEQETQEDETHTQTQADQTPTPKSGSEGSGSDAMDVEKREQQDD